MKYQSHCKSASWVSVEVVHLSNHLLGILLTRHLRCEYNKNAIN